MTSSQTTIRFGTRGSDLALWQTEYVMGLLKATNPDLQVEYEIIKTRGDQVLDTPLPLIGGKGLFTAELEAALYAETIDSAVHSLKDLPTEQPQGLVIGAIPERANPADALISRNGYTLDTLPKGATIGTSSTRRAAQLLHRRPDLQIRDIRGNVNTRIRKGLDPDGGYDAIILACAGLERLGFAHVITQMLDFDVMLPAAGQGAIAVQSRDEQMLLDTLSPIHHQTTSLAVTAERAFLAELGGGCSVPVAAFAQSDANKMILRGRVSSTDGQRQIQVEAQAELVGALSATVLGKNLAREALSKGAKAIMERNS